MYITISSNTNPEHAHMNSPHHFKVCLDNPLNLNSNMECALVDFTCFTSKIGARVKQIFIYLNMVEEQPVGTSRKSLLRNTIVTGNRLQMEKFTPPYYKPVKQLKTNVMEVYITDENGMEASFLNKTTTCTFHFKKKSWPSS